MDLEISERVLDGVVVIELAGTASTNEASNQIRARFKEVLGDGNTRLVVDLSRLLYIDSGGLGALVAGYTTARNQGGNMKLACPTRQFRDQLIMTKLDTVFDVYNTIEDALKSFGSPL
jgi:anti-sigma B factor antagonist